MSKRNCSYTCSSVGRLNQPEETRVESHCKRNSPTFKTSFVKAGEVVYFGFAKHLSTWNMVSVNLSSDLGSWWHFGFKCVRVRVLPMGGEISTLPPLLPPNFTTCTFTKRIASIRVFSFFLRSYLKRITSIHTLSLTLPSEDGESRQKPRGLKKGVPPFPQVCLLDFDFQYGHVGFCMMWRFLLWSFHGRSTKTFGVSFSWYYRHIYMSWYPNRYMIYTYGLFWYCTCISMFAMRRWWTVWFLSWQV